MANRKKKFVVVEDSGVVLGHGDSEVEVLKEVLKYFTQENEDGSPLVSASYLMRARRLLDTDEYEQGGLAWTQGTIALMKSVDWLFMSFEIIAGAAMDDETILDWLSVENRRLGLPYMFGEVYEELKSAIDEKQAKRAEFDTVVNLPS